MAFGDFGDDFFDSVYQTAREPIRDFITAVAPSDPSAFQPQNQPETPFSFSDQSQRAETSPFSGALDFFSGIGGALGSMFTVPNAEADPFGLALANKATMAQQLAQEKAAREGQPTARTPRALAPGVTAGPGAHQTNTNSPYYKMAIAAAQQAGIDPELFARQMSHESVGFDPAVVSGARTSPKGALGIAQFMPATARSLGVNPLDPQAALTAAARLMRQYLDQYGSYQNALIAYNAGPGAVGSEVLPGETTKYLIAILGDQSRAPQPQRASGPVAGGYQISFDYGAKYTTPIISDITGQPVTHHRGVDLIVPGAPNNGRGSQVRPFVDGTVVLVGSAAAAGTYVVVQDAQGRYHWYMHLDSATVPQGTTVNRAVTIGILGGSGTEEFPHLHYEVRTGSPNGTPVDPRPFMQQVGP